MSPIKKLCQSSLILLKRVQVDGPFAELEFILFFVIFLYLLLSK